MINLSLTNKTITMQNDALDFFINEFSVGNWAQNLAFYTLIFVLGRVVTAQVKTGTRVNARKQRVIK